MLKEKKVRRCELRIPKIREAVLGLAVRIESIVNISRFDFLYNRERKKVERLTYLEALMYRVGGATPRQQTNGFGWQRGLYFYPKIPGIFLGFPQQNPNKFPISWGVLGFTPEIWDDLRKIPNHPKKNYPKKSHFFWFRKKFIPENWDLSQDISKILG